MLRIIPSVLAALVSVTAISGCATGQLSPLGDAYTTVQQQGELKYRVKSSVRGVDSAVAHKRSIVAAISREKATRDLEDCSITSAHVQLDSPAGSGSSVYADVTCARASHGQAPASRATGPRAGRLNVVIAGTEVSEDKGGSILVSPFFVNAVADDHVPLAWSEGPTTIQLDPTESWMAAAYQVKRGGDTYVGLAGISVAELDSGLYRLEAALVGAEISLRLVDSGGKILAVGPRTRLIKARFIGGPIPLGPH